MANQITDKSTIPLKREAKRQAARKMRREGKLAIRLGKEPPVRVTSGYAD